jgi:hypothetical protein
MTEQPITDAERLADLVRKVDARLRRHLGLRITADGGLRQDVEKIIRTALTNPAPASVADERFQVGVGGSPADEPSPKAMIEAYKQMHETAKEMGYPSVLEALEHLDELRAPTPPAPTANDVLREDIVDLLKMAGDRFEMAAKVPLADPHILVELRALCERVGYGNVMNSASALWREKLGEVAGGEFATICRSTCEAMVFRIDEALSAAPVPTPSDDVTGAVERERERVKERCALIAEGEIDNRARHYSMDWNDGFLDACRQIATAIRSGETGV